MAKLKYVDIKAEIEDAGWELVEDKYTNLQTDMKMKCPEKHTVSICLKKWRRRHECPVCASNPYKGIQVNSTKNNSGSKRILAIDQATSTSGWCIFDGTQLISYGKTTEDHNNPDIRIARFNEWFITMMAKWAPDLVVFEDIQLQNKDRNGKWVTENVHIYKILAQLQGVLINTCVTRDIQFSIAHVGTWREYCDIKGRNRTDKKRSAQIRVKEWYDISVTQDEADAICIGRYAANKLKHTTEILTWE